MSKFYILLILISFLFSCSSENVGENDLTIEEPNHTKKENIHLPDVNHDLDDILKEGKLRASMVYSSTSYFLYKGQEMGFEYELLERFAKDLGVELEIVVEKNIDSIITQLNDGTVDLMAFALTITKERENYVNFSEYVSLTHQVLVQKKPENWRKISRHNVERHLINDPIELIGKKVSIRANTAYMTRINNLSEEVGGDVLIDTISGEYSTDEIIQMVIDGKVKYTVADDEIAKVAANYNPDIDISVPISFSIRNAWATRFSSPKLNKRLNQWLKKFKKEVDYFVIYNKYFKSPRNYKKRVKSDFYSLESNKLSPYDDLIKKNAKRIHWDWRLVASLVYQESRFDPNAKSWVGAGGLMQIMPATCRELGLKNPHDPAQSLHAGTKYLHNIWKQYDDVPDSIQRIKFTIASYNCGPGHVADARRLAEVLNLDKDVWDDNVEKMILSLTYSRYFNNKVVRYGHVRGIEPYHYVRQIFERHEHYSDFFE